MAVDRDNVQEESPMVRFYKIVLSCDYFQLLDQSHERKGGVSGLEMREVKDTYNDVQDYINTFEPLLFQEVYSQITQNRDQEEVTDWKSRVVVECNEVDGFHLVALSYAENDIDGTDASDGSISQNDLLLLSTEQFQEDNKLPKAYAFALVENCQNDRFRVRMYFAGEVKSQRLLTMWTRITSPTSEAHKLFYTVKICSLSTIAREYVALRSIGSLPFKDLILTAAEKNPSSDQAWKTSKSLEEYIKDSHNETQQEAIQAGLARKAFVLIQGPPGTGKTKTILGLLSAILHASPARVLSKGGLLEINRRPELTIQEKYKHWGIASPWLTGINPRDKIMPIDGDDGFFPTTGNELKPEVVNSSRKYRVRVLVCAPSNSALDEIVLRVLNTGVRDENGHAYNPKIVRIGLKEHHSVRAVSMDYLVKQKQESVNAEKEKHGARGRDKDSIRAAILDEAVIVFSTLSFSGSTLFSKWNRGFDVVIIDEAAQAVEPATLIPLANGCKQVFLVGDPVQLPATVISPIAEKFGYGTSLFKRLQRAGYPVTMLKTQYRMHPEIRSFPSREFYDESLEDGPNIEEQTSRDWHEYRCFGPFCFFDLHEGQESKPSGSESWVNLDEAEFVILMYHKLVSMYPELKSSSQVAIISPYSQQVKLLKDRFKTTFGMDSNKLVDITTVDGCQGREKDVAIFSCVRASKDRSIGFLADYRRMNVGITRAKSSVLVVGSSSTLRRDERWNNLVESAEKRDCFIKVSKPYSSFFSDENLTCLKVKVEPSNGETGHDEMDTNAPPLHDNPGDAEHGQADEPEYGDGDMEMDGGGFDDD